MARMRLLALVLALAPGLAPSFQEWKQVEPGLELTFPADHGAHPGYRTEWWYLTGQVADEDGRRFGFQFTVFRSTLAPGAARAGDSPLRAREVFAGHLALTDVVGGRTRFAERLRRGGTALARASTDDLELALEDWTLARGSDGRLTLAAADPAQAIGLEFTLVPEKPLVLHGERGYSQKGPEPGNASAYVSWTRLATTGALRLDGRAFEVEGVAWFDHEFGSGVLPEGVQGWDWFGLELDDGRELMLFHLRRPDGSATPFSAGTLVERDGSTRALAPADFTIEPRGQWTSPRTQATYPAGWRLSVPGAGIELVAAPLVDDCELEDRASTGVVYWEGPVALTGTTTGRGYAELTGYAGSMAGRF